MGLLLFHASLCPYGPRQGAAKRANVLPMRAHRQLFGLIAFVTFTATGCADEPTPTPTPVTSVTSGSEADHERGTWIPDPAGTPATHVCIQAGKCCEAYIDAVIGDDPRMDATSTCAAVSNAATNGAVAEPGCEAAMDAWRQSLTTMNIAIPDACSR